MDSLSLNWCWWWKYTVVPNRRHRCGFVKCPVCNNWVSIADHKCFIQSFVRRRIWSAWWWKSFVGRRRRCGGRRRCEKNGVNYGGLIDIPVNYGGLMDTLHEAKKWNTLPKDYTHGKTCPQFFYNIVFRGWHSWRNRNRRMKEGERRLSIPLYWLLPSDTYVMVASKLLEPGKDSEDQVQQNCSFPQFERIWQREWGERRKTNKIGGVL